MVGLTSAAGVVGFLSEPDPELQIFALRKLNEQINLLWTEVAGSVGQIEALYEDASFPERELAALVAAKVYYNLQEYNESMVFALGAGKLFDLDHEGEFEDTIISKCIDTYIALSGAAPPSKPSQSNQLLLTTAFSLPANGTSNTSASLGSPTTPFSQSTLPSKSLLSRKEGSAHLDSSSREGGNQGVLLTPGTSQSAVQRQLNAIIHELFERCYRAGRYRQVVGIAVEARKLDVVRSTILRSIEDEKVEHKHKEKEVERIGHGEELMEYVLEICMDIVQEHGLRTEV